MLISKISNSDKNYYWVLRSSSNNNKRANPSEDIIIQNVYAPNNKPSKYMKVKPTYYKEQWKK